MGKLRRLSAWLNANGFKKESLVVLHMLSKQAGSCEPPFDKSHVSGVATGGTIRRGDRGPAVGYIQTLLERNGHPLNIHGVDCIFGPETMSAIKDFQRGTSIEETGEINNDTLAELEKAPKLSEPQEKMPWEADKVKEEVILELSGTSPVDPQTIDPQSSKPRELTPHELDKKYKKWSIPNTGSKKTQPNFFTIAGNNNYRSGKPINNEEFFRYLKEKHGITTIIDLMNNNEGAAVAKAGLTYVDIPLGSRGPKESDWKTIKSALLSGNALIHCRHGADRTGAVIARWEVELGLKTPEEAHKDSLDYGFKKSSFKGYYPADHPKYNPDPNRDLRAYILKSTKGAAVGAAAAASATPSDTGQSKESIKINGDLIYPLKRNTSTNLVVFYHGTGYGNQEFVLNRIKSLDTSNTMFLIPRGFAKNYSSVEKTIEKLSTDYGLAFNSKSLGGWSAGSRGFLTATGRGFEKEMLADPSANRAIMKSPPSGVYMEYNTANWKRGFPHLAKNLPTLEGLINSNGGSASAVSGSHNDILDSILSKLI